MTNRWRISILTLVAAIAVAWAPFLFAQGVTTGALSGTVTDDDGAVLPGVTVEAVHQPTGTRYVAVTDAAGRYRILNARVGGPYSVTAQLEGFKPAEQTDIFIRLGEDAIVNFQLQLGAVEETITVVGNVDPLISSSRTGSTSNVSTFDIENLPTVGRGLEDFARTNPFITVSSENTDPESISVAGRSSRYNNIQIDGAVNNDLFGLADQGTPGGQADTTPISLDAIAEIQLLVAPFDVRQGGFSGGGVNAITRSGTNAWKGSVFAYYRDDSFFGDGPSVLGEFGDFEEEQYGFRLGGPLVQDKAFFFVNGETSDKTQPTGWSIDGSGGATFVNGAAVDAAERFRQISINQYGFDPGSIGQQSLTTPSDKFFGRLDFNLGVGQSLTFRHNYVDASNDINRPGSFTFEFPTETYVIANETNSSVLQWNTVWGSDKFNEFRVTYQTIKDRRAGVVKFPWIEIEDAVPSGEEFEAGGEPFSSENALDQDVFELTDDFTWIAGDHTVTVGTHNEFFSFDNLFLQNSFGAYEFRDLDDYEAGNVRRFQFTVVPPGQPRSQQFDVQQIGLYAGDEWQAASNFTLQYGLRVDIPYFPDKPSRNPFTEETYGLRTDSIPDGEQLWSPRVGFNWDIGGGGTQQLRGGVGIFAGRTPYVWISNNYARTGIEQQFISATGAGIPFNTDPATQQVPAGASLAIGEFNLIDPDFKFPTIARYNLAYDRELPWWGLVGTAELLYADSQDEILYQNVNLVQTGNLPFDGRPTFSEVDPGVDGAYFITNTSEGEQFNAVLKLEKPYSNGLSGYFAYVYGDSKVVNDGTSSRAVSNFSFNEAVNPNNPETSASDYEVEHRFTAQLSYRFNRSTPYATTVSLFYNHQAGRPYSTLLDSQSFDSINGDGTDGNDLFYVPSGPSDVVIINGTFDQLDAYIKSDDCLDSNRGRIAPRNCSTAPWSHTLDLHVAQDIPVFGTNLQLTFDLLNLMNLLDEDSGVLRYANFNAVTIAQYRGLSDDGKPTYLLFSTVTDPDDNPRFTTHPIQSRWRAKFGVRLTF